MWHGMPLRYVRHDCSLHSSAGFEKHADYCSECPQRRRLRSAPEVSSYVRAGRDSELPGHRVAPQAFVIDHWLQFFLSGMLLGWFPSILEAVLLEASVPGAS